MGTADKPCLDAVLEAGIADAVADRLVELGATAIEQRDESTMVRTRAGTVEISAGFDDAKTRDLAVAALAAEGISAVAADVGDDGWSSRWREFFRPVVLDALQIVTPWMDPPRGDLRTITLDPGQAFGTGGHATTRLVLKLLEDRARGGRLPPDVLDVGTGSGILAVAAALLGARRVLGVDIDDEAVRAATSNLESNGVADRVEVRAGTAADVEGCFPLVLANIELRAFEHDGAEIARRVAGGGELLVSGLLAGQEEACLAALGALEIVESRAEDGWIALALRRP